MSKLNPRNVVDQTYNNKANIKLRHSKTLQTLNLFKINGACLDIGDRSRLTEMIEKKFNVFCDNTDCDLDYYLITTKNIYDNIFCFEVIEHLMNPLSFLEQCKDKMFDDAKLFMSTPARKPKWMRDRKHHFHEFNKNELIALIHKAGFKKTYEFLFSSVPWYYALFGFRTFLRWIWFNRTLFLVLEKND